MIAKYEGFCLFMCNTLILTYLSYWFAG